MKLSCVVAALGALVVGSKALPSNDTLGRWGEVFDMKLIPIHSMLLPDGQVLAYGTDDRGRQSGGMFFEVWDTRSGEHHLSGNHNLLTHNTSVNIFCSTMSLDPSTGNVLIIGGDDNSGRGVNDVVEFNTQTLEIRKHPKWGMHYDRWYGTSVTLPDGRVFVCGGKSGNLTVNEASPIPEVWSPDTGFRALPGAEIPLMTNFDPRGWFYPHVYTNSQGHLIVMIGKGIDTDIYRIDVEGDGSIEVIGTKPFRAGKLHPSVMYNVDKVLMLDSDGGLWDVDISDSDNVVFTWKMNIGKTRVNGVFSPLPDGRVIITGGNSHEKNSGTILEFAVYDVQIWDPVTNTLFTGPDQDIARLYHSTALILPDGTVFSAGGGAPGPLRNLNGQVYMPSYLFLDETEARAPRPVIEDWPRNIQAGDSFHLLVDDAQSVKMVSASKSGSVTHARNCQARWLNLTYEVVNDQTLRVFDVPDRNVMIPGIWLLTTIDAQGVPSEARIMGVNMGQPTSAPSESPSTKPSQVPSLIPSEVPSLIPSEVPSLRPSEVPSLIPSEVPSLEPSALPSLSPTAIPREVPSTMPSAMPSLSPTLVPSSTPSGVPSESPTSAPSGMPSPEQGGLSLTFFGSTSYVRIATEGGCAQPREGSRRIYLDPCDQGRAWRVEAVGDSSLLHSGLDDNRCLRAGVVNSFGTNTRMFLAACDKDDALQLFQFAGVSEEKTVHVGSNRALCMAFLGHTAQVGRDPIIMKNCVVHQNLWTLSHLSKEVTGI